MSLETSAPPAAPPKARDPVCGMSVDTTLGKPSLVHGDVTYHFCCKGCHDRFAADPDRYLAGPPPAAPPPRPADAPPPPGAIHTCPMHPQVRQAGPGVCPDCGMALEPELLSADDGPNPERADMTRRLIVGAVLTTPVFGLEMGGHLLGHALIAPAASNLAQLILSAPVVLWCGLPFFQRGWASLRTGRLNMFTLVAMGVGAAFAYSLIAALAPGRLPAGFTGMDGAAPVYFEAAAMITVLVLLGQVLELRARDQVSGALRALLNLTPRLARRIRDDGVDEDVAVDQVRVGDRLRVRAGEAVPVDGEVIEGEAAIDESLFTGESLPVARSAGQSVIGGSLNRSGALVMRARGVGAQTQLARIVQQTAQAQRSRAPIQSLADRVSAVFAPAVIVAAAAAFVVWALFGPAPRLAYALMAAVSVLIIACPCALGLATPMSVMVGMGRGARAGLLVRNAQALQTLERVAVLVIDKTGALTEGRPALIAVRPAPGWTEGPLLTLAASLERASDHPLARAVLDAARDRGLTLDSPQAVLAPVGRGLSGRVGARAVAVGGARLMAELGVNIAALEAQAAALRAGGVTAVFVAVDGAAAGLLALADPVRPSTAPTLAALRRQGLRVIMATGDAAATARAVASGLGLDEVRAELSPAGKADLVRELKAQGLCVAMAGDGVNDAPALAAADVGLAMGGGADVAMETAGVVLLNGDLRGLLRARRLSRAVMGNIRQNLILAFSYNAAAIPLAAGVLYPLFGWLLSPPVAAAAMAASSVSVISNALRLRGLDLDRA